MQVACGTWTKSYTYDKAGRLRPAGGPPGDLGQDYLYGSKGMWASRTHGDEVLFFHRDHLGSTRTITDSNGHKVGRRDYWDDLSWEVQRSIKVAAVWRHGVGWTQISIVSNSFNQRIIRSGDLNPYGPGERGDLPMSPPKPPSHEP